MRGRFRRVGAALGLVAAVAMPSAPRPAGAATARVVLADLRYAPAHLQIQLGDTVIWEAGDGGHTVTARDGSFDSSPMGLMDEGDEFRWRFRSPGTFAYFCRIHGSRGMQGDVVVVDPSAPATTAPTAPPQTVAAAPTPSTSETTATTGPPETTTTRPLATSSTTNFSRFTATTAPSGTAAVPQEAPPLNPDARVAGTPASADLASDAAHTGSDGGPGVVLLLGVGALAVLALAGGGATVRARARTRNRPPS